MDRVSEIVKQLSEDVVDWVELRVDLAKREIKTEIRHWVQQYTLLVVLGIVAGLSGMIALALGIGAWLGHPAWGFLVVTLLASLGIMIITMRMRRRSVKPVHDLRKQLPEKQP